VLEEKDPNADSEAEGASEAEGGNAEKDVLGKLMGREKKHDPAGIEEIPSTSS
jgi:hypothetical protein